MERRHQCPNAGRHQLPCNFVRPWKAAILSTEEVGFGVAILTWGAAHLKKYENELDT